MSVRWSAISCQPRAGAGSYGQRLHETLGVRERPSFHERILTSIVQELNADRYPASSPEFTTAFSDLCN